MAKESVIHRRIKDWLKGEGWLVWKNHGSAFSEVGLPDLMAVRDGVFLAVEVKTERGVVSAMQRRWLAEIEKAGGIAIVARCVEDVSIQTREKRGN